jgi:hypothetical protein
MTLAKKIFEHLRQAFTNERTVLTIHFRVHYLDEIVDSRTCVKEA